MKSDFGLRKTTGLALGFILLSMASCSGPARQVDDVQVYIESAWLEVSESFDSEHEGVYKIGIATYEKVFNAEAGLLPMLPAGDYGGGVVSCRGADFCWDIFGQDVIDGTIAKGIKGNRKLTDSKRLVQALIQAGVKVDPVVFRKAYLCFMDSRRVSRNQRKTNQDTPKSERPPTADEPKSPPPTKP